MTSKDKWNRIYAVRTQPGDPAIVLIEQATLLPAAGLALDVACGLGANSLFLAERGLTVEAWDISDTAISKLTELRGSLPVRPSVIDINADALRGLTFDVIVNCHYLDRALVPALRSALAPGGLLVIQTFVADRLLESGPSNPAFLLQKNELMVLTDGMEILAYRDGSRITDPEDPLAGKAYIVARQPAGN